MIDLNIQTFIDPMRYMQQNIISEYATYALLEYFYLRICFYQ